MWSGVDPLFAKACTDSIWISCGVLSPAEVASSYDGVGSMLKSPIERLLELTNAKPPVEVVTRVPSADPPPGYSIESFNELVVGLRVFVDNGHGWTSGRVHKGGIHSKRGIPFMCVKTTGPTIFFYADRWENGRRHVRRVEPRDGIVGPRTAADVPPRRPEAKVDGLTPDQCLELYTKIQREQEPPFRWVNGQQVPTMTAEQLRYAKAYWSAALDVKRVKAINERVLRERAEQLVCDDDRWEV